MFYKKKLFIILFLFLSFVFFFTEEIPLNKKKNHSQFLILDHGRYNEKKYGLEILDSKYFGVLDYYQLCFLKDGSPGKLQDNNCHEHPGYGYYLARRYLAMFKETNNLSYLLSAEKIFNRSVSNMTEFKGGLIYYFRNLNLTSHNQIFYSALIQSHYLKISSKLYNFTKKRKYLNVANKLFKSLILSTEESGVAIYSSDGIFLKEYQTEFNSWVLNGFLTTINNIYYYYASCINTIIARWSNRKCSQTKQRKKKVILNN